MNDEAVKSATGRTWPEWFAALDADGCRELDHPALARHLAERHGVSPWWSQSVAIEYEIARGSRERGERSDGFGVDVQRTVRATPEQAWAAWTEAAALSRWFTTQAELDLRPGGRYRNADGDAGTFKRVEPPRRLAFTWENQQHQPGSVVEVTFSPRPDGRTTVRLSHTRLANADEVADLRHAWSWAMDSYRSYVETGAGIRYEDWSATHPA
jgi:uncharacterized protein YndB with AHSA1/START domain